MWVNKRIETEPWTPWIRKVHDVDIRIAVSLSLAPQQQSIFGWFLFTRFIVFVLFLRKEIYETIVKRQILNDLIDLGTIHRKRHKITLSNQLLTFDNFKFWNLFEVKRFLTIKKVFNVFFLRSFAQFPLIINLSTLINFNLKSFFCYTSDVKWRHQWNHSMID